MTNKQDITLMLQDWYSQYCDGYWEHNETINIHTIDSLGWMVTIDLQGTHCENKSFEKITNELNKDNWYHCDLRDGKFEGRGGACNLIDILSIFENWACKCQKEEFSFKWESVKRYDGVGRSNH